MKYRVAWKSKITGATGYGEWFEDLQFVQSLANEANKRLTSIEHWVDKKEIK